MKSIKNFVIFFILVCGNSYAQNTIGYSQSLDWSYAQLKSATYGVVYCFTAGCRQPFSPGVAYGSNDEINKNDDTLYFKPYCGECHTETHSSYYQEMGIYRIADVVPFKVLDSIQMLIQIGTVDDTIEARLIDINNKLVENKKNVSDLLSWQTGTIVQNPYLQSLRPRNNSEIYQVLMEEKQIQEEFKKKFLNLQMFSDAVKKRLLDRIF